MRTVSMVVSLSLGLVVAGSGIARAESFIDIAATSDGGAWLLVDVTGTDQPVFNPDRVELRHVSRDGAISIEPPPRDEPIGSIVTAADDALWGLTWRAVLRRDRTGSWTMLDMPGSRFGGRASSQLFTVTPLTADRALVARSCQEGGRQCSELFVVDLAAKTAATPMQVEAHVESVVGDGRGGAWALIAHDDPETRSARTDYAHFDGASWTVWTHDGKPLAGMQAGGKVPVAPVATREGHRDYPVELGAIAASRDGLVGIYAGYVYEVATDGAATRSKVDFEGNVVALVARGDERSIITEPHSSCGLCIHEHTDCTPTITVVSPRHDAVTHERVPTPLWWRRDPKSCPRWLRADEAGGQLWLVTASAVFRRDGRGWHTIEAAGPRADLQPLARFAVSAPLEIGGVARSTGGDGVAFGVRPELVVSPDVVDPSFGVGPYVELARLDGGGNATYLGGGLTFVGYGQHLTVAASLGVDETETGAWHGQLVSSWFLGIRRYNDPDLPLDAPFGVRVDIRPRTDTLPTTVSAMLTLDGATLAIAVVTLGGVFGRHD